MRADAGDGVRVGTAVDRGIFPENVQVANFQIGGIADVFEILGLPADRGEGEKLVGTAEFRMPLEDHVRVKDAVVAKLDIRSDDAEWPDADIASQNRGR